MQNCITKYFENIKDEYGDYERLYKLFKTDTALYLYDVGTGKVMQLGQAEYQFLFALVATGKAEDALQKIATDLNSINGLEKAIDTIKQEHLLQAPVLSNFDINPNDTLDSAKHSLRQITLEMTQQCNMACKYCIYSSDHVDFRNFGKNHMTWETAKKAIDYALACSGEALAVTFYGGEPLLEFNTIKRSVEYVQSNSKGKTISYSLTTNLTLMTPEIASFFSSIPQFAIVGSIDGVKEIHDKYRVFHDETGTFDKAIDGLKVLVSAYGEEAEQLISLSMVQAGAITGEMLEQNRAFFNSLDWLPPIEKRVSYVRTSSNVEVQAITDSDKFSYSNPIGDWTLDTLLKQGTDKADSIYTYEFFEAHLSRIHNRILTETPYPKYSLNGCCVPASRKLYITVDGKFHICERIGKSPAIGNVNTGLDKSSLVQEYLFSYCKKSMPKCANCWAIRLCSICYMDCYDENGFRPDLKDIACLRTKTMIERELVDYHTLLERNPNFLDRLNQVTLV